MDLHLQDRVVVVVGGASGIGLACVEQLALEGARPVCWDIKAAPEQSTIPHFEVDITAPATLLRALEATETQIGPIFGLIHAAAVGSGKFGFPFTNLTPDDWKTVLNVNIMGMTHVAHAVAPLLRDRRNGVMIFLASVAGQIGSQTDPPYSASKAANINFAQCLAKDLAAHSVRVNTICPGMVRTPLNRSVWQAWHDAQPENQRQSYDEWAGAKVRTVVPLQKWQEPSDIANMAVFLLSDRAGSVTGQTINVDGGFVMHW